MARFWLNAFRLSVVISLGTLGIASVSGQEAPVVNGSGAGRKPAAKRPATGAARPQRTPASEGDAEQPPAKVAQRPQPRLVTQPQKQPAGQPAALAPGAAGAPVAPVAPEGFPLPAAEQARVDQILSYWESKTSGIKTYQCRFTRQNFDQVFGEAAMKLGKPFTIDKGVVRYSAPDKGEMKVEEVWKFSKQAQDPKQPFVRQEVEFGEWWLSDGASIYQFDSRQKVLTETRLPPEMHGQAIGEGPLPFLFGAKAETMKERYWIRDVTPKEAAEGEYWLEAFPKRQADAANFSQLLVSLALQGDQLLPSKMKVINPQGHMTYHFTDQAPNDARHRVAGFLKFFVRPSVPRGWTKVVENWDGQRLNEDGTPELPPDAREAKANKKPLAPIRK